MPPLASKTALVAVHYGHDEPAARETVHLIEKDGGRAFPVRAELGVTGDVDTLFAGLEAGRWVTGRIIDASGGCFLGPRI